MIGKNIKLGLAAVLALTAASLEAEDQGSNLFTCSMPQGVDSEGAFVEPYDQFFLLHRADGSVAERDFGGVLMGHSLGLIDQSSGVEKTSWTFASEGFPSEGLLLLIASLEPKVFAENGGEMFGAYLGSAVQDEPRVGRCGVIDGPGAEDFFNHARPDENKE